LGHPAVSPARRIAYDILTRVSGGGFAADLLFERCSAVAPLDAALASQLVFGCLRFQGQLDHLIQHYSGRKLDQIENTVRILLRLGIYQLRYLDRVPPHAAVHESVELAKAHRRVAAGFVNAVLRKVKRNPVRFPGKAIELSCPEWLLNRWTAHFGVAAAESVARAALEEPVKYIRLKLGEPAPAQIEIAATEIPGCFRVASSDARGLRLQDIGSQSLVPLLELSPGESFIDLCAAPGNKTAQALETAVQAVACDVSFRRLAQVPPICPRVVADATRELPFRPAFDKILVDAPCSGTGTIARNPEIKWRVTEQELARFHTRQTHILVQAMRRLGSGGRLVYSTCSLEPEENEEVVRAALATLPGCSLVSQKWRLPGRDPGDGFYAAVITSENRGLNG
jgi:16S rRNA (cytosine967-C5)-methyltransferase